MTEHYKYPRTPHLPFSPGATNDDRILQDYSHFEGKEIIASSKMDGENSSLYHDYYHARSLSFTNHPSRNWLKQFHASIAHDIPEGFRICGENMYALHSIAYDNLESFFLAFSVWNEKLCLSWDETLEYLALIGIAHVPVLYRGVWDITMIQNLIKGLDLTKQEGVVIRLAGSFTLDDFGTSVCKWVRKGHVQTDEHWKNKPVVPNKMKE